MPVPILSTKITPPRLRSKLVNRQRLFEKLDQGMESGCVLVSAPAGYGKTTLLSAWLKESDYPTAWVTLDQAENDPVRFLKYLATALHQISASASEALWVPLQASPLPAVDILLVPLVNQLVQLEQPFWLVLDDYHVIQNPVVHEAVSFLLENRPEPFHLAIATRADPPLPLSRLRARCQMTEMRMADLRFSSQEIEEFFLQLSGVELSREELAQLEISTEGWAAGLQMASLSLQGKTDTSSYIRSFSGENRYILDFLFEEVFQQLTEEHQSFLLKTAVLEQLSGPLCRWVTGLENSPEILETMRRNNLFLVSLDEQKQWYRFHHLFSDLLNNRLRLALPDAVPLLHRRASEWFAAQHDLEHAIIHALAAQDFEQAACLIEQIIHNLDRQNQQSLLASWVNQLPRAALEKRPWLCVFRAWGDYWAGRRGAEEEWLLTAEQSIDRVYPESDPERQRIRGHIAAVQAHIAIVAEDIPRILEKSLEALELLPDDDAMRCETATALGAAYWALGTAQESEQAFRMAKAAALEARHPIMVVGPTCYAGMQQVKQGNLQGALATFQDGLRLAKLTDGQETPIAGFPKVNIGDILRERNDLDSAEKFIISGARQCLLFSQPDVLMDSYVCLGRYQLATGNLDAVQETLQMADHLAQQSKVDPFLISWLDEIRLKAWLADSNLDAAVHWSRHSGMTVNDPLSYLHDLPQQNLARVLTAESILSGSRASRAAAAALLARLQTAAKQAGWVHDQIKILILQSLNETANKAELQAQKNLGRALQLAQQGGYVRVFVDEGETMHYLLISLVNALARREVEILEALKASRGGGEKANEEWLASLEQYALSLLAVFRQAKRLAEPEQAPVAAGGKKTRETAVAIPTETLVENLSARELEVLALLAQGYSDKQIAEHLYIARETVHKHLKNIYGKLDVHSRTAAAARAHELGLI